MSVISDPSLIRSNNGVEFPFKWQIEDASDGDNVRIVVRDDMAPTPSTQTVIDDDDHDHDTTVDDSNDATLSLLPKY